MMFVARRLSPSNTSRRAPTFVRSSATRSSLHASVSPASVSALYASNSGKSISIHCRPDGSAMRYGRVSRPAAKFTTMSAPCWIFTRPTSWTCVPDGVSNDSKRRPPAPGSNDSEPGRRPAMRYRKPRRHHRSISCVKTSNATAGSTATLVETVAWSPAGRRPRDSWPPARPFGVHLERGELGGPERFHFLQPAAKDGETLRPQAVHPDACVVVNPGVLDEAVLPQHPKVTTQARRTDRECGGNVAGALRLSPQQFDDASPRRIGKREERVVDLGARH